MSGADAPSGGVGARTARGPRLARIPRELLHVGFDDLAGLGVPEAGRLALRALVADLPLVPRAVDSAVLVGEPGCTLPCLAALARHVGQGLRDHNVGLIHDRTRLRSERLKLAFLSAAEVEQVLGEPAGPRLLGAVAVLFVHGADDVFVRRLDRLLAVRAGTGRASFVAAADDCQLAGPEPHPFGGWRRVSCRRA